MSRTKRKKASKAAPVATREPGRKPIVGSSHALQQTSRRMLEAAVHPWLVTRWVENDFGIDAIVEITEPIPGTRDHEATGRLFAVQLKATESEAAPLALSVGTGHLRLWLEHSLPVLLVSAHVPSNSLRARWIDDDLLVDLRSRHPTLWSAGSVTISLADVFDASALSAIGVAVLRLGNRRAVLAPSTFFSLRARVSAAIKNLGQLAADSKVESASLLVQRAVGALSTSPYTVAVVGPQRVGKSTLTNALLGIKLSPVADYPTTAVPVVFDAAATTTAEVEFVDDTRIACAASESSLEPYAAQRENDDNKKGVRLIRVCLPNDMLARGITLVDTPGRHDASEAVRNVTVAALEQADAVLYVLDAGLNAKFKLGQAEIEDLKDLRPRKDRLLIVLNQADLLDEPERERLFGYVRAQLQKYGIWDGLPTPPEFISGQVALAARLRGETPPEEFLRLEDNVWGHLLRSNATGLHRLDAAVCLLARAADDISVLLTTRAMQGVEAAGVVSARARSSSAVNQAHAMGQEWSRSVGVEIVNLLAERNAERVAELGKRVASISLAQLPTRDDLQAELIAFLERDRAMVWQVLLQQTARLATELGEVVHAGLSDTRAALGMPPPQELILPRPQDLPPLDIAASEEGAGILGGLFGFLGGPVLGLITTAFGWLVAKAFGDKRRRADLVRKIPADFDESLKHGAGDLVEVAQQRIEMLENHLVHQARGRLETFIADAERQLGALGAPIESHEAARLAKLGQTAKDLRPEFEGLALELRKFM